VVQRLLQRRLRSRPQANQPVAGVFAPLEVVVAQLRYQPIDARQVAVSGRSLAQELQQRRRVRRQPRLRQPCHVTGRHRLSRPHPLYSTPPRPPAPPTKHNLRTAVPPPFSTRSAPINRPSPAARNPPAPSPSSGCRRPAHPRPPRGRPDPPCGSPG